MDDIERFIKTLQRRRQADQCKLEHLDVASDEHRKLMKKVRDLSKKIEQRKENITKHLNMITAHKHSIHKIIHSANDISGLPVPHDYAQDMRTMFTDVIDFLNNGGDTCKALGDVKENNMDPVELIQAVTTCTEAAGKQLYQTKCSITQLEMLKEDIAVLQQHILNNSDTVEDASISLSFSNGSTDSGSTLIK
ncbi:hypothetical protein DMN91_001422 [Ooceraea biroi]|uniref:Uncharacterized protein n=1 Tax=Ooceraea biroi TaxID=2015173 RepID=A0A3L8E823_OOCBI|nr:uncharacterized protein LOC105280369 [Ooceraea biroi]RLU27618.1 hypothetical protein DMN91_001422 [Ooceraea biroi]